MNEDTEPYWTEQVFKLIEDGGLSKKELIVFASCRQMGKTRMTEAMIREMGYAPVFHTLEVIDDDIPPKL